MIPVSCSLRSSASKSTFVSVENSALMTALSASCPRVLRSAEVASATSAPVRRSCSWDTSDVFPQTPALPVQAFPPAVCSH